MFASLRAATSAVIVALALGVAPGVAQESRSIRIAVEGANPPFNFIDASGQLQGFDVDLGKALCAAMKANCSFVQHQWDGIIRGLIERQHDAVMSSLAITESRARRIAFSRRYFLIRAAFLTSKGSDLSDAAPQSLTDKPLATVDRTQHALYARATYPASEIKLYGKLQDAILELLVGRAEAVLGDKTGILEFLKTPEGAACCRLLADVPTTAPQYGKGIAIGLRKEDADLKAGFDAAIDEVMKDGTYDRIRARYFPFDTK